MFCESAACLIDVPHSKISGTDNRKGNTYNSALYRQVSTANPQSGCASGNGRHDGNVITFIQRGRFFLQVADVLVVDIEVDEGA